jgi:hypothetical protein
MYVFAVPGRCHWTPGLVTPRLTPTPVFFIVFRETLETGIIVAILLSFLKQNIAGPDKDPAIYRKLRNQVGHSEGKKKDQNRH